MENVLHSDKEFKEIVQAFREGVFQFEKHRALNRSNVNAAL